MIELAHEHVRSWIDYANAFSEQRRFQEAYDFLRPALARFSKDAACHVNLACYACQFWNLSEARELLAKTIEQGGEKLKRR